MNKGFSLVELIVVIAIMAILVGVAVPVYTSYITKANDATDIQAIDNLEHACKIVAMEYSTNVTFGETNANNKYAITATLTDKDAADQLALILDKTYTTDGDSYVFSIDLKNDPVNQNVAAVDGKAKIPANID